MKKITKTEIEYYKELEYWTPLEAAALILGVNPKSVELLKTTPDKINNIVTMIMRAVDLQDTCLSYSKEGSNIFLNPL